VRKVEEFRLKRLFILCLLSTVAFLGLINLANALTLKSLDQVEKLLKQKNYDLRQLTQEGRMAEAGLMSWKADHRPSLGLNAFYSDSQKQPTNAFQPARIKSSGYEVSIQQRFGYGLRAELGLKENRNRIFQSEPENPQLPYPETFYEPAQFLRLELDLLKDLFGAVDRADRKQLELEKRMVKIQKELTEKSLLMSVYSLLWSWKKNQEMKNLIKSIVERFDRLRKDIQSQVSRNLSEPGDLFKIKANLQRQRETLSSLAQQEERIRAQLGNLVGEDKTPKIASSFTFRAIEKRITWCESFIRNQSQFKKNWSKRFNIQDASVRKAILAREKLERKSLPDLSLSGELSYTGTDTVRSDALSEVGEGSRPVTSAQILLTIPLSGKRSESNRLKGQAQVTRAQLNRARLEDESRVFFEKTKKTLELLLKRYQFASSAIDLDRKQIKDLNRRYQQGRVSLFELIQEENAALQGRLAEKNLWMNRGDLVFQFLSRFENMKCSMEDV
jgi:outer membrane protein TolC